MENKIDVRKHRRRVKSGVTTVRHHKRSHTFTEPNYYGENTYYVKQNKGRTIMSFPELEEEQKKKNPYADPDRDGVTNKSDCHPLDPTRQDKDIRVWKDEDGDWSAEIHGIEFDDFGSEEAAMEFAKKYKENHEHFYTVTKDEDGNWNSEIDGAITMSDAWPTKEEAELDAEIYIEDNRRYLDRLYDLGAGFLEVESKENPKSSREAFKEWDNAKFHNDKARMKIAEKEYVEAVNRELDEDDKIYLGEKK